MAICQSLDWEGILLTRGNVLRLCQYVRLRHYSYSVVKMCIVMNETIFMELMYLISLLLDKNYLFKGKTIYCTETDLLVYV